MAEHNPGIRWRRLMALAFLLLAVVLLASVSQAHRSRVRARASSEVSEIAVPLVPMSEDERARIGGGPPMGALGHAYGR